MISNAQKALLHVAKSRAGLTDDDYRALLKAEAGVDTSIDLDNRGLNRVLKRLGKMGFTNTAHRPRRSQPRGIISPEQMSLIEENFERLARMTAAAGKPGFHTAAARMAFNRRCCKKALPQTRGDANKVIEGQKAILRRATGPAQETVQR